MTSLPWCLLVVPLLALGLCHCTADDTGANCGDANVTFSQTPVGGEDPVLELVRLDRDKTCLTFQCLTHHGLQPYCTKSCKYNKLPDSPAPVACKADSDCSGNLHCFEGFCNDDDCPKGFWCETVQDVGALAGQRFCTRRENCTAPINCEDITNVSCVQVGCYDRCLSSEQTCGYHQLVCEPLSDLGCDANLNCYPPGSSRGLGSGNVAQRGVCYPHGQN